jgi:hypothetical protein
MTIPLSLAGVGGAALGQGITFLYSQAGDLLGRHRARKDVAESEKSVPTPMTLQLPSALGGQVLTCTPDPGAIESRAEELLHLRSALSKYADGCQPVDLTDLELRRTVGELRITLEAILGYRLTFVGEDRPPTGQPLIASKVQVGSVAGLVTGIDIQGGPPGTSIQSEVLAQDVETGGNVTGVRIGKPPPTEAPTAL